MFVLKRCKKCGEEKLLNQFGKAKVYKGKQYYQSKCKPCHKISVNKYQKNNWSKKLKSARKSSLKLRESEGKGVYLVKYRWINFYVGEGAFYDRKGKHLKYKFSKNNTSDVAKIVDKRNLNRKYLSFHVLEHLDDKPTMRERERHYRRELKPYINPLD